MQPSNANGVFGKVPVRYRTNAFPKNRASNRGVGLKDLPA